MNITTLIAISGVILSFMFPLGRVSTNSLLYQIVFTTHILTHLCAIIFAVQIIINILKRDLIGKSIFVLCFLPTSIFLVFNAFLPITHRDALIHHIAVPQWWNSSGEIFDIMWHSWSHYPMLTQLAYSGFLQWDLPQFTVLYQFSFLILLAALIGRELSSRFSDPYGQIGILLTFSTPLFIRLATAPYVDLSLATYAAAFTVLWLGTDTQVKYRSLILGLLLGLTAATKYNGLLFAGLILPFYLFRERKNISGIATLLLGSGITGAPWYIKNWLILDNPVFPLLSNIFPYTDKLVHIPQIGNLANHSASLSEQPLNFLLLPVKMLFFGKDNDPAGFDGILTPFLILFLIPPLIKKEWRFYGYATAITLSGLYATLLLSGPRSRYFAPFFGLLLLLAISGLQTVLSKCSIKLRNALLSIVILYQCATGLKYLYNINTERELSHFYSENLSKNEYLNKKVTESYLADHINSNLSDTSKIYLLYTGNRYSLYKKDVINSGYYSERLLLTWLFNSDTPEELKAKFDESSITHIALHAERYQKSFNDFIDKKFLTPEKEQLWNLFLQKHITPLAQLGPYRLWQLTINR